MPTQVRIFAMPKSLGETLASTSPTSLPHSVQQESSDSPPRPPSPGLTMTEKPATGGITFAGQDDLPKLPIPSLESTAKKYLASLRPLQGPREHAETQAAVQDFLKQDGPELQERLQQYAEGKTSYIEQFCKPFPPPRGPPAQSNVLQGTTRTSTTTTRSS